jgi:hypothetical protein
MRLQNRLEGWWPLIDTVGTANEYTGGTENGTINGTINRGASGILGDNCYDFDGSSGFVDINDTLLFLNSDFTVSFWFNVDTLNGAQQAIFNHRLDRDYVVFLDRTGTDTLDFFDGTDNNIDSVSVNTWYHFVGTFSDTANTFKHYIDGLEVDSRSGNDQTAGGEFRFGADNTGSSNFDGRLFDIRVYSRPLPPAEVNALYERGRTGNYSSIEKTS